MLKLILHHKYNTGDGVPVDISDHGNHGIRTNTSFLASGYEPSSGALKFNGVSSRVTVRHNPTMTDLRAIMVEAWVNPTKVDQRRNIIEGDNSFAVYLAPIPGLAGSDGWQGVLHGDFRDAGGNWVPLCSGPPYSPDGNLSTVPRNTWSKITYFHDGVASAVLLIDDKVVAERYDLQSGVGSVGNNDLIIGSWTLDDSYAFLGAIDEVRLWKYDPDNMDKEFFCKFKDPRALECLARGLKHWVSGQDAKKIHRNAVYIKCMNQVVEKIIRTVYSHGREAKETWEKFHERYLVLWCKNEIGGPEMEELMQEWAEWLCRLVGPDTIRDWVYQAQSCQKEFNMGVDRELQEIWKKCDPDFFRYIDLFVESWRRCIPEVG